MTRKQDTLKQLDRQLARLDKRNLLAVEAFLREKRLKGCKPKTLLNYALALAHLDDSLQGNPIWTASPETLMEHQERSLARWGPTTVGMYTTLIRSFLKWKLDTDGLPRPIRRALTAPAAKAREPQPVTDEEFAALLTHTKREPQWNALLWVLWETGMRNGEIRALNVGSVTFDNRGGAELALPDEAPDGAALKTGPRRVPIVEAVGPLRAWLSMHPYTGQPDKPLFLTMSGRNNGTDGRLYHDGINKWMRRACKNLGLRAIHPHLFRHAVGTRMARRNWSDAKQCQYAGWGRFSKMPRYYAHLDRTDLIEQVRRDAGIDDTGHRLPTPGLDDAALEGRLRKALKRILLDEQ